MSTDKSELRSAVEQSSKRRKRATGIVAGVAVVALTAGITTIAATHGDDDVASAGDGERLSLQLATDEDSATNDMVAEVAAENGLDIEWVNLNDWVLPNTEVLAGNMDGNSFQNVTYLSNFNAENDADLRPVFSTFVSNWGVFSSSVDSIEDLPDGATIAVPDDASNGGRALKILEAAEIITVDDDAGPLATPDDITENPKNLEFVSLDTQSIPQQFDDPSLDAVVVGAHHFDPSQGVTVDDALFIFDPQAEANMPYTNVIATRADNTDNPAWEVLEDAYDDPRVLDSLEEEYSGTQTRAFIDHDVLRDEFTRLQEEASGGD